MSWYTLQPPHAKLFCGFFVGVTEDPGDRSRMVSSVYEALELLQQSLMLDKLKAASNYCSRSQRPRFRRRITAGKDNSSISYVGRLVVECIGVGE